MTVTFLGFYFGVETTPFKKIRQRRKTRSHILATLTQGLNYPKLRLSSLIDNRHSAFKGRLQENNRNSWIPIMVTRKQQQEIFDSTCGRIVVFELEVGEPEREHKVNRHF